MSALIWKEWRENYRWALLAALLLLAGEIWAFNQTQYPGQMETYFNQGITLCKKPFLMVTLFGHAAVGLALGFLQIVPELKRDRWAALLHRPLSRGRFYWGKALAGSLLYLLATGLPFLLSIWLTATPGHFATPFVPAMVRPGLVDLAAGWSYYLAALLIALEGGSLALRAVPLLAALYLSFSIVREDLARVAFQASLGMALALLVAGWGTIQARDSLSRRPWLSRLAVLFLAFYGACGLGLFAQKLGAMAGSRGQQTYARWEILENGVPARLNYVDDILLSTEDAAGHPFQESRYGPELIRSHTLGINGSSSFIGESHGYQPTRYVDSYRETSTYLEALSAYSHGRLEQWFRLPRERTLIGMLPAEKKAFATFGAEGFGPPTAHPAGLEEDMPLNQVHDGILAIAPSSGLQYIRLDRREIQPVPLPAPGPVYGLGYSWARQGQQTYDFLGVALAREMAIYDAKGALVARLPYHHEVDRWGRLSLGILPGRERFVLQYEPSVWLEGATQRAMPSYVDLMDAQGQVLASTTLPPLPRDVIAPTWSHYVQQRLQVPAFLFGEMLYRRVGAAFGSERLRHLLEQQFGRGYAATVTVIKWILPVALLLAALTFGWARRAQVPATRAAAWALLVLALGLPGFLMFWVAGQRPRLLPCPACRRPRRLEDEACGHCGAGWPAPSRDGTEILDEPLPAEPALAR